MMPIKKTAAEECCAKCEKDVAALRKEIAALRKELAKKPAGGADPRVDAIVQFLKSNFNQKAAKAGIK
tara:strand:+ start:3412 stop:3615 length:204 start_codon:yes stop_codon:yes gene_type:complete